MRIALYLLLSALVPAALGTGLLRLLDPDHKISIHGYMATALGIGLTFALGFGLIRLAFWSARTGRDDTRLDGSGGDT